jgi:hypothetical protein
MMGSPTENKYKIMSIPEKKHVPERTGGSTEVGRF